jgi:hypothetical protein
MMQPVAKERNIPTIGYPDGGQHEMRHRPLWPCHQAAKLAGWFGAYSALFSMPEMFYIEPVNELVEELTRGAVMGCVALERGDLEAFALL